MQTGSLNTNLSNARISRYFGGGSGEPTTRDVVHFSRLSIPNGFPLSANTPDMSISKATSGRPSRPHRTFIIILSHNEGVRSTDNSSAHDQAGFCPLLPRSDSHELSGGHAHGYQRSNPNRRSHSDTRRYRLRRP